MSGLLCCTEATRRTSTIYIPYLCLARLTALVESLSVAAHELQKIISHSEEKVEKAVGSLCWNVLLLKGGSIILLPITICYIVSGRSEV